MTARDIMPNTEQGVKTGKPLEVQKMTRLLLRLILAGLALTILFYIAGASYIRTMLPFHADLLPKIQSQYEIQSLQLEGSMIKLETLVHRNVADGKGGFLRVKRVVPVSIASAAMYIQPIILLSIILAWPAMTWHRKVNTMLLALPVLLLIGVIDIPFVLAWEVEDSIAADVPGSIKTIAFAGMEIQTRIQDSQLLTYWYVFLQTGGRQFLALLGAITCIITTRD